MHLQFISTRSFVVAEKDVIKIVRGATRNAKEKSVVLSPRSVVELTDAKARKMLKTYPRDCEAWGIDAVAKAPVKKAQNSKPKTGHQNRDIA